MVCSAVVVSAIVVVCFALCLVATAVAAKLNGEEVFSGSFDQECGGDSSHMVSDLAIGSRFFSFLIFVSLPSRRG
ncbi:hypothetical protein YC2023_046205 [Brassica napus]|uniref:(rape) hypothetical protein n=1 Tax=Brassica napus TaxID=3708 RepID=A0A817AM76_BRANA|nr:unnamed protein product [Brassica napus]